MGEAINFDNYILNIAEDDMSAEMMLTQKEDTSEKTLEDIVTFLVDNGVQMGIQREKIRLMLQEQNLFENYTVALGKHPIEGENGYFELKFDTMADVKPLEKEDGSVDFLNTKLFEQVSAGDVIAKYNPPGKGEFGYTIRGKFLMPKPGKDLVRIKGRGFDVSEDGRTYTANISGKIEYKYGEINISEICEMYGNLDMTRGHVRFSGDVIIHGDVASGMIVDAMGNVEIDGHVGGATIKAGKNVMLKKGVQGAGKATIEAKGNVYGQFFEECKITCEGNIEANYLLNCNLYARGKVSVKGRKGLILGGRTHGILGVEGYDFGNDKEMPTRINIGIGRDIMNQYADVVENIKKIEGELETLEVGLAKVNMLIETEEFEEHKDDYIKIFQAKIIKNAEKKKNLEKRKELYELINNASNACCGVYGTAYPGVVIDFDSYKKRLTRQYINTRFKCVDGDIRVLPLD